MMPAPIASKELRQAPAVRNPKWYGSDWKECQLRNIKKKPDDNPQTRWGQDIVCPNIHVRSDLSSSWVFSDWGFVTTVENAETRSISCWVDEKSRNRQTILPCMLSWDEFQDSIKRAREGSFPEDLVLRLPWVQDPLKAGTEIEWRMSMAVAEVLIAGDHRMWCRKLSATIVVCRAKEFRTLVDQGWLALMDKLKEGEIGDADEEAQSKDTEAGSTTDPNVAEGHDSQVKDEHSSTADVADATVGDVDGGAATETTTTTTTTIHNPTTTTTTTTIITTVAGGSTTTNTTTTTTSTKRKNNTQAESRECGNNKRLRGSTAQAEQNTTTIDLEQEK